MAKTAEQARLTRQTNQAKHEARVDDRDTRRSLLVGFLAWFAHLNLVFPLTSLACKWGWFPHEILGMPGLKAVQVMLTIIAALVLAVTILSTWRIWRRFQTDGAHAVENTQDDRRPLLAFVTMLLNGLFMLYVVASLVPILTLQPCS